MSGTSMSVFAREYAKQNRLISNDENVKREKNSKYGAIKTKIGDIVFDSKIEASFYVRLTLLLRAKQISEIVLQPSFLLQEEFRDQFNCVHKSIFYRGDFKVVFSDGIAKIYDTKGFKTEEYRIKKKLLLKRYPHLILEEVFDANEHPIKSTYHGGLDQKNHKTEKYARMKG